MVWYERVASSVTVAHRTHIHFLLTWWCHKHRQFSYKNTNTMKIGWRDGATLSLPCLCKGSMKQAQIIRFQVVFRYGICWSLFVPKGTGDSTRNEIDARFKFELKLKSIFIKSISLEITFSLALLLSLVPYFSLLHFHPAAGNRGKIEQ